jgi:hypothetical protein
MYDIEAIPQPKSPKYRLERGLGELWVGANGSVVRCACDLGDRAANRLETWHDDTLALERWRGNSYDMGRQ